LLTLEKDSKLKYEDIKVKIVS